MSGNPRCSGLEEETQDWLNSTHSAVLLAQEPLFCLYQEEVYFQMPLVGRHTYDAVYLKFRVKTQIRSIPIAKYKITIKLRITDTNV